MMKKLILEPCESLNHSFEKRVGDSHLEVLSRQLKISARSMALVESTTLCMQCLGKTLYSILKYNRITWLSPDT
ncbi:disease resistance protein [Dorcoceras hygrometricum]|uniref:Disease resistance protein n=1 Tax=Dorcoceras hygrometricum TaxID=472368 RepID=A0A2Z7D4Y2_9LAMI|nr:disease resistance protein [Dorcoceras hygrometricum]